MGRRKIEIQPITHERNRSVTFLKRKNGLFKKAYELGVLCSVDVAVIIFEDRPGHQRKLYQYCSSDVHDIVQQHLRHDGERDTRGPIDFSGTSSTRNDDAGDGDDYGEDDDEGIPPATRKRAKGDGSVGKLKPAHSQDSMTNSDMDYHPRISPHSHAPSTFGIPPPIARAPSPDYPPNPSHPMSRDRLRSSHQHLHKKPKLGIHDHGGEDRGHGHPEDPGSVGGRSEFTFPPPSSSPSFRHPQHPSSSSLHPVSYGGPQYSQGGFFSGTPTSSVPPSSYMQPQADISSSRGRGLGNTTASAYSPQSRSRPSATQGGGSNTGDMLVAYLDAEPSNSRRVLSAVTGGSGVVGPTSSTFSLDWPAASSSSSVSGMAQTTSPSSATSTNSAQGGSSGSHWLDFLSGNNTPTSSGPRTNTATPQISSAQSMRWAAQPRPQSDTSVSGHDHRVSSRASGRGDSGSRVGEVKKEG